MENCKIRGYMIKPQVTGRDIFISYMTNQLNIDWEKNKQELFVPNYCLIGKFKQTSDGIGYNHSDIFFTEQGSDLRRCQDQIDEGKKKIVKLIHFDNSELSDLMENARIAALSAGNLKFQFNTYSNKFRFKEVNPLGIL